MTTRSHSHAQIEQKVSPSIEIFICLFREIADIFVNSVEFVFALIDGVVAAIVAAVLAVRSGICFTFASVASAASSAASAVAAAGTAVGGFVIHPILSLIYGFNVKRVCFYRRGR